MFNTNDFEGGHADVDEDQDCQDHHNGDHDREDGAEGDHTEDEVSGEDYDSDHADEDGHKNDEDAGSAVDEYGEDGYLEGQ